LRVQLSQTNAEKLQIEVSIRAELGNEMQQQLKHIKSQYQRMLQRQQTGDGGPEASWSSSKPSEDASTAKEREDWKRERSVMEQKIRQLQDQLSECEDEIKRIQQRHEQELDGVRMQPAGEPDEI
jgi:chromosome segregation ATPase